MKQQLTAWISLKDVCGYATSAGLYYTLLLLFWKSRSVFRLSGQTEARQRGSGNSRTSPFFLMKRRCSARAGPIREGEGWEEEHSWNLAPWMHFPSGMWLPCELCHMKSFRSLQVRLQIIILWSDMLLDNYMNVRVQEKAINWIYKLGKQTP